MPKKRFYFFMPLASIGGTEMVHTDILGCIGGYGPQVYIRYRTNVWKGREWAQTLTAKQEGRAMLPFWEKLGAKVHFMSPFMEAPRFGRLLRRVYLHSLARKINRLPETTVIFWHREAIRDILPFIKPHVRVVDVVHNNSNTPEPDAHYLLADWAPRIDHRVVVSPFLKKMLSEIYAKAGLPKMLEERISVIPHKVFIPDRYTPKKGSGPLNVLFVGRPAVEKRFHLILRIIAFFAQQPGVPAFHFHIAGPEKKDFPESGEWPEVTWHGMVLNPEQMRRIYADMDVLLLTSSSEGFPKVIAEAAAYGVVPVATNVGGIGDFIRQHENGILVTSSTDDQVFEDTVAALTYAAENREKLGQLSQNIYACCQENFAENKFNDAWLNLLLNA